MYFFKGQTSKKSIDSIWSNANKGNAYTEIGSKEVLRLCTEIYYQSEDINYDLGKLRALTKMSEVYMNEQNYKESLSKLNQSIILANKMKDYIALSSTLVLESKINSQLGYYKRAEANLQQALRYVDKVVDQDKKHLVKASIYKQMADNIDFELVTDNSSEKKIILDYLLKAYHEISHVNNGFPNKNIYLARAAFDVASGYFYEDNIVEAERYLNEFQKLIGSDEGADFIPYYRTRGEIENEKKNYEKAIEYFNKGIQLYNIYKVLTTELAECYSGMAVSYDGLRDYKNKALYLEKSQKLKDSIYTSEKKLLNNMSSGKSDVKDKTQNAYKYIIFAIFFHCFTDNSIYPDQKSEKFR